MIGSRRRGFALPAALAAVVVFAGLAAAANAAALAAIRETGALVADAQADAARESLRARVSVRLRAAARRDLMAGSVVLDADTAFVLQMLAWPWHRVSISVHDSVVAAEAARALAPSLPWCAGVVRGAAFVDDGAALSLDPASRCVSLTLAVAAAAIDSFAVALDSGAIADVDADSVTITQTPSPALLRARSVVSVSPGAHVVGLIVASVVRLGPGSSVHGMIVARDTLAAARGAAVTCDETVAAAALQGASRLALVGRRGLLLPP